MYAISVSLSVAGVIIGIIGIVLTIYFGVKK